MIVDLPKDGSHDSILVIVDSFTKYIILVECSKKLKAPELADLFLRHIWKKYSMPEKTVSDQGQVFNNKFLKALYQHLGIDPHYLSAYHPQSNGQTEHVNLLVEHFLRAYSGVNQRDWVKWLPMAEFTYNNAVHSATGRTPFKALHGWEPTLTPSNVPMDIPKADDLATQMESQWKEIKLALQQSKSQMIAGEEGSPLEFKIGEEAWLDAKNLKLKTLSPKLNKQRVGPFKVIEKISNQAYQLELLPSMQVHNVFYMGLLSKVRRDDKRAFENRPLPVTIDMEEEYDVEGITDMEKQDRKWLFRVKWKGYRSEDVVDTVDTREFTPIFSDLNEAPTSLPHLPTILSWTPTRSSSRASSHAGRSYPQSTMATRHLEPQLPPTSSVEYGEVSLERVTQLLLGLLGQVERLKREIAEIKEAGIETRTNVENISQTVDVVKDGLKSLQLQGPRTPEGNQPKAVEETPRPIPKTEPIGSVSRGPFWSEPTREIPGLAQPTPRRAAPLRVPSPPPSPRLRSPIGAPAPPPPAPVAAYPTPVKVDHPDAYTGKIGSEAKQWLTRMLAWTRLNSRMFPTDQEVLSFLLMNMKDSAGAWAHPHLDQLGSHRAIIQTVEGFKMEFLAAFGDPDATRAAKWKITTLTQSGTCADYITKFRTLAMELDWNDAALRGQFARGLHWEVSRQIATREHCPRTLLELQNAALVIDNALREERASHPPRDNKSSKQPNPARGTSTGQPSTGSKKLSDDPNFVSEEERNCRRAAGACIKCGKMGHKFAECRTGWKATPTEDKGKAKETAKIGKDSKYQSGKE
ncbi:integrase core domain protein [Rhizoctonia solani]|uniref:Integrase core domain protein n=1 Tax=Rhizoctonia solani TaxID=456999 RepID=A0A8H8NYN8_9AGAM|nr:integrase core domain protein [Rhizoctonia solani]QRW22531.1 integrase core domain protein [Rhizoctonia solani]